MLQIAERLVADPDRFSIVPSTISFRCSPSYVGIYFALVELATDVPVAHTPLVMCHVTMFNLLDSPQEELPSNLVSDRRMLRLHTEAQRMMRFFLTSRLPFATMQPIVPGGRRILCNIHAQGLLHVQLWGMRSSALAMLQRNPQDERRDNFHLSVDRLVH